MRRNLGIAVLGILLSAFFAGCGVSKPAPASKEPILTVYYFHRTIRCPSCLKIEALTKQTVETAFAGELAAGRIVWKVINLDDAADAHFEQEYDLQTQSVVLSKQLDGKEVRWKNLEKVWDLLDDDTQFVAYIEDEIRGFMNGSASADEQTSGVAPRESKGDES